MPDVNWNTVPDGELYKWTTPGQVVEGLLNKYEAKKDTGKGPGNLYEVLTKDGIIAFFAPSLLHKKLERLHIKNEVVRIEYISEDKTKSGNTLKVFDVKHTIADEATLKMLGIEVFKKEDNGLDGF